MVLTAPADKKTNSMDEPTTDNIPPQPKLPSWDSIFALGDELGMERLTPAVDQGTRAPAGLTEEAAGPACGRRESRFATKDKHTQSVRGIAANYHTYDGVTQHAVWVRNYRARELREKGFGPTLIAATLGMKTRQHAWKASTKGYYPKTREFEFAMSVGLLEKGGLYGLDFLVAMRTRTPIVLPPDSDWRESIQRRLKGNSSESVNRLRALRKGHLHRTSTEKVEQVHQETEREDLDVLIAEAERFFGGGRATPAGESAKVVSIGKGR